MVFTVLGRSLWSLQEADCGCYVETTSLLVSIVPFLCGEREGSWKEGATFGGVTLVLGKKGKGRN